MTPQEKEKLDTLETKLNELLLAYNSENFQDKLDIRRSNINIGNSGSKVSLYGGTPALRANAITTPTGGATVDSECRTAVTSILTALRNLNIITP